MRESFLAYVEALGLAATARDEVPLERAAALLETATTRDPLFAQAWLALGRVHLRRFEVTRDAAWLERAAAAASRVAADRRWTGEGYRLLGAVHTAGKRPAEAATALDHAATAEPACAEVAVERAVALQAAGRAGDAEREFQRAIFMRPGYWPPHHLLAKLYLSQGRYEAAATQWREVIDCAPRFTRGYNNLGLVYFRLGRTAEARELFERSLAIESSRVALSNLGTLYFDEARFADAVAVLERASAEDGSSYKTWGNLAFAYKYAGVPEKSAATFRRATELAEARLRETPGDAGVTTDLAGYVVALGERERGRAVLEPVLATSPSDPHLIADIAECLWDLGDRDRALEWVERALRAGVARRRFENRPTLRELVADERYRRLVESLARPT
jgi:tetratricopeptide (TPR) repeat protein